MKIIIKKNDNNTDNNHNAQESLRLMHAAVTSVIVVCKRLKIGSGNSPGIQHSLLLGPHRPDHCLRNVGGKPLVGLQVMEDSITAPEAVLL